MKIEYYTDKNTNTTHSIVSYNGVRTRLRSEVLIIKDNKILLSNEFDDMLSIPGGGIEKNETPVFAAKREAQEEVRINVKNVKQTRRGYLTTENVLNDWMIKNVPEDKQWKQYYTYLCIGEYDSEFTGKVDKVDQDKKMLENASWFDISKAVYFPTFKNEWRQALEDAGYLQKTGEDERIKDVIDQIKDIKYGFFSKIDGKRIDDREWIHNCSDLDKYYKVEKDPIKTISNKLGICQDQAIAIKYLMNKLHPEDEVKLWALRKNPKGHCVVTYCHDGKWYYLENAWNKEMGLHGPYKSEESVKNWLKKAYYYHHKDDTPKESEVTLEPYVMNLEESYLYEESNTISLREDTRNTLVNKSKNVDGYKNTKFGKNRWERKRLSKVANKVKMFNDLDMNMFVKQDTLLVNVPVQGETNEYTVTLRMEGVMTEIQKSVKGNNNKFEYKNVVQALVKVFNSADIKIKCTCDDFKYNYAHNLIVNNNSVDDTSKDPGPGHTGKVMQMKGQGCKHILLVLSNQDWIMKLASTVSNYIKFLAANKKDLFMKIIFPKLYGVDKDKAIENNLIQDEETLETSKDIIDTINKWAVEKGRFKKGSNKNTAAKDIDLEKEKNSTTKKDEKEEEK